MYLGEKSLAVPVLLRMTPRYEYLLSFITLPHPFKSFHPGRSMFLHT